MRMNFCVIRQKLFIFSGGIITMNDFTNYSTRFGPVDRPPIITHIKNGLQVCGPPPPSSASLVASIFNIVDGNGSVSLSEK